MSTEELVGHFLQDLAQRNLVAITSHFADQVDWYVPGDTEAVPWAGVRRTRDEVRAFFQLLWSHTEPLSATVEQLIAEGDTALVAGCFSTRMLPANHVVDSPFSIQITVRDGLIVRYRLLEDSHAVSLAMRIPRSDLSREE